MESDFDILKELVSRWEAVTDDPKLDEFIRQLRGDLLDPARNPSGKLVIFSEAKDTTDYLSEKLAEAGVKKLIAVSAANRKSVMPILRANFDANAPAAEKADDLDIIISTEVLAEGVNLHRANIVVNYDTPWNSTRLMQRLGRVNRIGSTAPLVHIYNFFPTANVDRDIDLQQRALLNLQAFHTALGEDSQIYSPEEEPGTFGMFEKSPEDERDERLEFLDELRRFRRENPGEFRIIKNLPLRARVGRRDRDRADSTIAYVRNARRDAFYRIAPVQDADPALEELGFVEAARIFRAGVKEKAGELPPHHHDHVLTAIDAFREQLSSEAVQETTSLHQIGPNERRAMELLAALQNLPPAQEGLLSSEDRERLNKEFFESYKRHYQAFVDNLILSDAPQRVFGITAFPGSDEFPAACKPVRDWVKRLLGRIVFLHFLQKKGWMGVPADSRKWVGGDPKFLQSLFASCRDQDRFHSTRLAKLFTEALNRPDRKGDIFDITGTRVPYLNGGLFEDGDRAAAKLDFPAPLFSGLLDFLEAAQVRPLNTRDIPHVRELVAA